MFGRVEGVHPPEQELEGAGGEHEGAVVVRQPKGQLWDSKVVEKRGGRTYLPYHPTSSSEWNSSVMAGMAVVMIVRSRATRNMASSNATITAATWLAGG